MSIPIGNALFEKNFEIKKNIRINHKFIKNDLIKDLNFSKVDHKKFPAIKLQTYIEQI